MRRYLLDTSLLAAYLQSRKPADHLIRPLIERHEVATSILVYAEVRGLPYAILERYADMRRKLRPPYGKGLIGDMDTLIAATALERNLTLLTTDSDFERVPNLKWQLVNLKAT